MYITRWNRRRLAALAISVLILYWIFSASNNEYESNVTVKNVKPEDAWEYVADFHKMKLLNPTILDFKILSDRGHLNHWKYTVEYTERLSHWPFWINVAEADFEVRKLESNELGDYIVTSQHRTCFFAGLYCLHSSGEFRFTGTGPDTYVVESVRYQCPPFLGRMCRREVEYQRKAIMKNLIMQLRNK